MYRHAVHPFSLSGISFSFLMNQTDAGYTIPIAAKKTAKNEFRKGYSAPRMNS